LASVAGNDLWGETHTSRVMLSAAGQNPDRTDLLPLAGHCGGSRGGYEGRSFVENEMN